MNNVLFGAIMPHPPILIPFIGGERIKDAEKSQKALIEVAKKIKSLEKELDAIVVITPHGAVSEVTVPVYTSHIFEGNFVNFGFPKPNFSFKGSPELAVALAKEADQLASRSSETVLDHGVLVPLYYPFEEKIDTPILPIAIGILPLNKLFEFGKKIRSAAENIGKKIAVIASADMSHRLTEDAPSGYSPKGAEFDKKLFELVRNYDVKGILNFPEKLASEAGQDALWSIAILLGALDGDKVKHEILSYEGPFGVGYMVAIFHPSPSACPPAGGGEGMRVRVKEEIMTHPLVELARKTIEEYVNNKKIINPPQELTPEMKEKAGVFVSLKKHGELRGCIGTFQPTTSNVAEEIIRNAIESSTQDPRFSPVKPDELKDLEISVDVLTTPVPVASTKDLDAKKYGVIIKAGMRRGLLLPDLEGVNTPEDQIAICRRKAGIGENEPVELSKFEVKRFK